MSSALKPEDRPASRLSLAASIGAYNGVVPDLFREGQGVFATGHMNGAGVFVATRILAKPPRRAD